MEHLVRKIIDTNSSSLTKMRDEIIVDLDHQGKRHVNLSTSRFYKKRKLDHQEIVKLVLTSVVAIEKMLQLPKCGWSESELLTHLYNGIAYYQDHFEIDLSKEFVYLSEDETEDDDLTDKFPAKYKAIDGHFVRSRGELLIDNILFAKGILHAYETRLPGSQRFYCDFYIPPNSVSPNPTYIEYWGIENDRSYDFRRQKKLNVYEKQKLQLIELFDSDIDNLYETLSEKLYSFNIDTPQGYR